MLTKDEFKNAAAHEFRIIRHVATKIDPAKVGWRPREEMRTTLELLQYLSMCAFGPAKALGADSWDVVGPMQEEAKRVTLDSFDAAMAEQERALFAHVDAITDADWTSRKVKLPWGTEMAYGEALFETTVRFLVAYRMQLFLYAKQSCDGSINTYNNWMGIDQPEEAPA